MLVIAAGRNRAKQIVRRQAVPVLLIADTKVPEQRMSTGREIGAADDPHQDAVGSRDDGEVESAAFEPLA